MDGDLVVADLGHAELHRIANVSLRQSGAENFPVALRLLPREARDQLARVYTFARFVDDVGDEALGDRRALLDTIDDDLTLVPSGGAVLPPVRAMTPLVRDRGVPLQALRDLVEANRQDQVVSRYDTFDELLEYCRLSAAPIGRIVLALAGVDAADLVQASDRVCAALQVLEHCQDVDEDAAAGRIYLPSVDLRAAGVAEANLTGTVTSPALRHVVALQVERAEALLSYGPPLTRALHGWARLAVTGYVAGGLATARSLRHANFDVLARHIRPTKLGIARAALAMVLPR